MSAPANKYFDAAVAIGRILVRDAIWADDKCFWLTQSDVTHAFGTQTVVSASPPGLADGACGVGLFLARLLSHDRDRLLADVVAGVQRFLIGSLDPRPAVPAKDGTGSDDKWVSALMEMAKIAPLATQFTRPEAKIAASVQGDSISSHWRRRAENDHPCAGLYRQLNRLHAGLHKRPSDELPQPGAVELAEEAIRCFEGEPEHFACFCDPLFADAFLVTAMLATDQASVDAVKLIADHVIESTERHGQPWRGAISREYPPIGLADGLAGVGHFLLRLAAGEIPPLLPPRGRREGEEVIEA